MSRAVLDAARAELADCLAQERAPIELLQRLADEDPMALVEVVIGPRAPSSPLLVDAALQVLDALEGALAPKALYQRLVTLSGHDSAKVLQIAASRHPLARWLVRLSKTVEGSQAGHAHLLQAADHPAFGHVCQMYAEAGQLEGLLAAAATLGRPEPAAQLAAAGQRDAAASAIVRVLEKQPDAPVFAWAAAGWGPDLEPLVLACVRQLRDRGTAAALAPWLAGSSRGEALLRVVSATLPPSA